MGVATAITLGTIGLGSSLYSADRQAKAQRAERRAQIKANEMEKRRSDVSNQRERRLAAAQLVQQQQFNIAQGAAGGGQGSAVIGSNIGLSAGMGGSIGFNNTMLAANLYKSNVLQQGANKSAKYSNQAGWGSVVSEASFSGMNMAYNPYK